MSGIITLAEARSRLDATFICLEPREVAEKKLAEGKEAELWGIDLVAGRICRGDGKFHDARVVSRGNYNQLVLHEEPNVPQPESGSGFSELPLYRVVGHVIVAMNNRGLVRVRWANGLNGKVLELLPSSISKDQLAEKGMQPVGYIESNPQRIEGMIAVYFVRGADFPAEEGMDPDEFRNQSTDGRSLAALAKAGL
jgi:hypothetical protein